MNYKKRILIFLLIICVLFSVSSVVASDINNSEIINENTAGITEDVNDEKVISSLEKVNEETQVSEELSDDTLAVEEGIDTLKIEENDINTVASKKIENDEPILTSQNTDKNILSDGNVLGTVKADIYKQTGKFSNNKKIYIKITNAKTGKGMRVDEFGLAIYNYNTNKELMTSLLSTNSKGIAVEDWLDTGLLKGVYKIKVKYVGEEEGDHYLIDPSSKNTAKVSVDKNKVTIKANKLIVPLKSKKKFKVKAIGKDKKPVNEAILKIKVYTNSKAITKYLLTNRKGVVTFDEVSKLSVGKHKVKITLDDGKYINNNGLYGKGITSYIIVGKQSVIIKTTKLSTKQGSGKHFKAKIVDSKTKKPVKGVKIILKVYTGKKSKTITLKSNKKGIIKYSSASKLRVGKHKVILKVKKSKLFTGKSKTSSIKIIKTKHGEKSKSTSNKGKKGKIKTKIRLSHRHFTTITREECTGSRIVETGDPYCPIRRIPEYGFVSYPKVIFTPTLKGPNGKNIAGEYTATLQYSSYSDDSTPLKTTFKGKFGQSKSYTGKYSLEYVQLVIKYKGNSKYKACKYTSPWVHL